MNNPVSDKTIGMIAEAIFKERPVMVVEADSACSQDLHVFNSVDEICAYAEAKRNSPSGSLHLAVCYEDMGGVLTKALVKLDPAKCKGHTFRYKAEGWGLIWVHLWLKPSSVASFISANSEKRAQTWSHTHPEAEPPSVWNWAAVARHLRRLRRVLKLAESADKQDPASTGRS